MSIPTEDNINPFTEDVENKPDTTSEPEPQPAPPDQEPLDIDTNEPDRKVVRKPKHLLTAHDEFTNAKSDLGIRLFHSEIKKYLDDKTKEFVLLVNNDINKNVWSAKWANNPELIGLEFIEKPDLDVDQNLSMRQTDSELPITVQIIDASSPSYISDENGQHYPDQVLKYSNSTYWFSDDPNPKFLTLRFKKMSFVKYIAINFHQPDKYEQTYNILYKTDKHDIETGESLISQIVKDVKSQPVDGLQIVVLDKPILTDEIYIDVISPYAAINYITVISNELSEEALDMFINSNVLEEQLKSKDQNINP